MGIPVFAEASLIRRDRRYRDETLIEINMFLVLEHWSTDLLISLAALH
jgi:hypothetical protein